MGDYCSGTNHVLPTYGYARAYSGLSVHDFLKRITVQELTPEGLRDLGPTASVLAGIEGLDAHALAVDLPGHGRSFGEARESIAQISDWIANLLDNAVKYREPTRPLRIVVRGRIHDGHAVYTVADNGLGIAPEHQAKVFEIFHRLNPDANTGEGLGLTIAQRVLDSMTTPIVVEGSELYFGASIGVAVTSGALIAR